jgi:hypothetical protein
MLTYGRLTLKVLGFAMTAVVTGASVLSSLPSHAQDQRAEAVYVTDMSRCRPEAALSPQVKKDGWQLIPYETVPPGPKSGTMIGAASFVDAPDVTLQLGVAGWHAVYVGFWNPHHAYDGGTTVKVKLSDDPCFTRISEPEPGLVEYNATYIKEAMFKTADLTGCSLQFGKPHGPFAQKAYIAYVKLVPIFAQQVADVQVDRARKDTRVLQAAIDGISYFWANEYQTREHIMELIEPYRYSDVGKVIWAVNYGDRTNYPTKVGRFCAEQPAVPIASATNHHIAGEKVAIAGLTSLAEKGIIPVAVAAQHAHAMGLEFDIMFRLAIVGSIPPMRGTKGVADTHPQFRQVMRDGTPVEKASYAFPEVRNLMVSIIREAAETFDVDGANLCFTRGPSFTSYEQPVLDDFRKEYNEDGRKVGLDDARMRTIHCRYLNEFVRDVRKTLDEVGKKKGKRLELSAWTWTDANRNLDSGMDVEHWIGQGWLDSVLCLSEAGIPINPELIATAKSHKCPYILAGPSGDNTKHWVNGYNLGVDGFAIWDCDALLDSPTLWPVLRRTGHRKEIEAAAQTGPAPLTTIRLKTVGGFDVLQGGLCAAAYSGG